MLNPSPRSSIGQSVGLRSQRLGVRVTPGTPGGVPEWFNGVVLKTIRVAIPSEVRILLPPPFDFLSLTGALMAFGHKESNVSSGVER